MEDQGSRSSADGWLTTRTCAQPDRPWLLPSSAPARTPTCPPCGRSPPLSGRHTQGLRCVAGTSIKSHHRRQRLHAAAGTSIKPHRRPLVPDPRPHRCVAVRGGFRRATDKTIETTTTTTVTTPFLPCPASLPSPRPSHSPLPVLPASLPSFPAPFPPPSSPPFSPSRLAKAACSSRLWGAPMGWGLPMPVPGLWFRLAQARWRPFLDWCWRL